MKKFRAPQTGMLHAGNLNSIADVADVRVGHCTLDDGDVQTGVTVIHPHSGDIFLYRVPAASTVINGFGKSLGLVQLNELGAIETPVALTNTFAVGEVATAQMRAASARHPEIGRDWPTVNPLVLECNDGYLNDIQAFAVRQSHYQQAMASATTTFEQGSVGAGRGMSCCQLKGGIGSASRIASWADGGTHTVGALVLANFGRLTHLMVGGVSIGRALAQKNLTGTALADQLASGLDDGPDKGSIIIVLATDAPLESRQLKRLSMRAAAGLARTGSVYGHGSGDIALAFSTAYHIPYHAQDPMPAIAMLHETRLDALFEAAAEATEQAIVNALWAATTVHGRDGHSRQAVAELLPDWHKRIGNGLIASA